MSFNENWEKASVDGASNDTTPPPEGTYEIALAGASAFTSKKGAEVVKLELRVVGPQENGHEWTLIYGFTSQGQANAAKAAIHRLGVDVDAVSSFEELDKALQVCLGRYYQVNVVRNGEYVNTYFEEALAAVPPGGSDPATGAGYEQAPPIADEDIPF